MLSKNVQLHVFFFLYAVNVYFDFDLDLKSNQILIFFLHGIISGYTISAYWVPRRVAPK